jgi:malate synthase
MEDAATAEICRAQVWQWIHLRAPLDDGRTVTRGFFEASLADEMKTLREVLTPKVYDSGRFPDAIALFSRMSLAEEFEEFLTLPAYRMLEG